MKPLSVVHLITGLNIGGAEMALLRLLTAMDRERFEARVVCMIPLGPVAEKIQAAGIPIMSLEMRPGRPTLSGMHKLLNVLKQVQPDILQTWLYHADLTGLLAAKLAGTKTVIWNIRSANMDFQQYGQLSGWVFKVCAFLSGWPKAVIVNSRAGQMVHTELGYHPKEWHFIPNGIDTAQFQPDARKRQQLRQEWQIAEEDFLVGLVGRLDPMKDHRTFLKAAGIVQARHPQTRFVCVGDGSVAYQAELNALSGQLNLSQLLWAGSRADMPAVYNAFDILVSSSIGEGFPNVIAEAMACERPCVITNVGDSTILVAETGLSVPPGDPAALAEGILQMLALPEAERARLGQSARQRIVENFSLEQMVQTYSTLYERLA